jgi:hypothetical protein
LEREIARINGQGESQVGKGVLVSTVDLRFCGERCQTRQGGLHLRSRSFEQPSTTASKKCIPAKEQRLGRLVGKIRDMACGVPRHVDDFEFKIDPAHPDVLASREGECHAGDVLPGRTVDGKGTGSAGRYESADPAGVIAMVVGEYNSVQF